VQLFRYNTSVCQTDTQTDRQTDRQTYDGSTYRAVYSVTAGVAVHSTRPPPSPRTKFWRRHWKQFCSDFCDVVYTVLRRDSLTLKRGCTQRRRATHGPSRGGRTVDHVVSSGTRGRTDGPGAPSTVAGQRSTDGRARSDTSRETGAGGD